MSRQNGKMIALLLALVWMSACGGNVSAPSTSTPLTQSPAPNIPPSPVPAATSDQLIEQMKKGSINLLDNGKTFTYTITSRFSVFLDDANYPLTELKCEPDWVMGYVSNGSLRGRDYYPVMYEATKEGRCILTDRDFHVRIVVRNQSP